MDHYDDDPAVQGLGPMDTSTSPAFALFNTHDSHMVFLPDQTLDDFQAPPPDVPMQLFLQDTHFPDPEPYVPDLSPDARTHSASPAQSQIPSPSIHGSSSSYGAGVTSSLESALDSTTVVTARSRANTSLSPPAILSAFPLTTAELDLLPTTSNLEESVSHQQPNTVIGQMLKNIALTAIDAGDAFEKNLEQTSKVGELRERIFQMLDMLTTMTLEKDTSSHIPSIPVMPGIVDPATLIAPVAIPPMEHVSITDSTHLSVSESRKRCASELEEHRTVKALKREPQDDAPLMSSMQDASNFAAANLAALSSPPFVTPHPIIPYATPASTVITHSQPPSRPPTPPAFPPTNPFVPRTQPPRTASFSSFVPPTMPVLLHNNSMPTPMPTPPAVAPPFNHSPWSDPGPIPILPRRHNHSLSSGSISIPLPTSEFQPQIIPNSLPPPPQSVPSNAASAAAMSPAIGRMSRSGSISGTNFRTPYSPYPYANDPYSELATSSWHAIAANNANRTGQSNWHMGSDNTSTRKFSISGHSAPSTAHNSPSDDEDDDDDSDSDDSTSGKTNGHHSSDRHSSSLAAEFPVEYSKDVDRIFFDFLNKLCSKLDATDSKGEQIHQTLMAKKMQRLDESPDFRPFKFRIQAFTNAFMDELAKQGYPEEKIPMKKARNYLWRQQYILRFNEDGKKAKSKGNHIWNVEARKAGEGKWEFRPFQRKLAGTPPTVAYCGLRWSWKPHVWHPQCSFKKIPVTYSSPSLPPWLSWKNGELSGIPTSESDTCQVTAVAKFNLDNQDDEMELTFTINIAPVSALDAPPYSRSRRPSLVGDPPKRSTSDSALFKVPPRGYYSRINRTDDTRVIQVLQNVQQRVTDEAELIDSPSAPKQGELQDLVKQKQVLQNTVDAYDKAISGQGHVDSRRLAVAAQHVVLQAAQTVMADRTVASGGAAVPQTETAAFQSVSVSELTDKTQDAIAMAVKMNGRASNEMDIIVTATSILKSQTPMLDTTPPAIVAAPPRPQATVTAVPSRVVSAFPPSTLSPLPEYT